MILLKIIYVSVRARMDGGGERETQADTALSTEPVRGPDPTILR